MKTKEELQSLKSKLDALEPTLQGLNKDEAREAVKDLDGELTVLSEDELKEITAGTAFTAGTYAYSYFVHNNCGGIILHVGNPFRSCCCNRCGETHYWHYSFDYTEVFEKD